MATAATGVDVNAARVGEQRTSKSITVMSGERISEYQVKRESKQCLEKYSCEGEEEKKGVPGRGIGVGRFFGKRGYKLEHVFIHAASDTPAEREGG